MNSEELLNNIYLKRPNYAINHEEMINLFSNKGNTKSNLSQFGPIYEFYIYAFFVGFNLKTKISLPSSKKPFLEIGKWSPKPIVHFIISCLFFDSDKKFIEIEDLNEKDMKDFIAQIINNLEEYAHGGFNYIKNIFDKNREEFDDPFVFANILKEITDKTETNK